MGWCLTALLIQVYRLKALTQLQLTNTTITTKYRKRQNTPPPGLSEANLDSQDVSLQEFSQPTGTDKS